ncbi:MAG: hypothetical protein Q8M66_03405 [Actinomycetota bacterium]|nr:hypothetical protein [Actinomycetota bacterium]MDZ4179092.1 hypothetical protein [Coriobacteriia bacterium]
MMSYERKQVQISAFIAEETKAALDRYVEATGLKKNRVIEEALQRHLAAIDEIPAQYIIETDIVVTPEGWEMIWDMIETEREPSPALVQMWKDHYEFIRTDGKSLEEKLDLSYLAAEDECADGD